MRPLLSKARVACTAVVFVLGTRVAYLYASYLWNAGSQRFHVESASLIFVLCGIVCRLFGHAEADRDLVQDAPPRLLAWCFLCLAALAIYWPVLSIGLLSDDYVLAASASQWAIGPQTEILFRPAPLLVWAVLFRLGASPVALHFLNIVLHGTNAYLAGLVLHGWIRHRWASVFAGILVLVSPLAPEAVAWCSGVFDLFASAAVMSAILVARRYSATATAGTRVAFIALAVVALMSKETAAVLVALVALDAWARRAVTRTLSIDLLILAAAIGLYGAFRLSAVATHAGTGITKYALQQMLFGTFGSLAAPWHKDFIVEAAPLAWSVTLGLIVALAAFFSRRTSRTDPRFAAAAALWVLIPVVPFWAWYFVAPDLQGARYLYLSAVGWFFLVIALVDGSVSPHRRWLLGVAVVALASAYAFATGRHVRPWVEAARLRDKVEASAVQAGMRRCGAVVVGGLPDTVRGAYVFRNGVAEAFERDLGIQATAGGGTGSCCFVWDPQRQTFRECGGQQAGTN